MKDDEIECVACGYTSADKNRFNCVDASTVGSPVKKIQLCNVCYGSLSGNAYIYPDLYRETKNILFTITAGTNMIIDEIQKGPIIVLKPEPGITE